MVECVCVGGRVCGRVDVQRKREVGARWGAGVKSMWVSQRVSSSLFFARPPSLALAPFFSLPRRVSAAAPQSQSNFMSLSLSLSLSLFLKSSLPAPRLDPPPAAGPT